MFLGSLLIVATSYLHLYTRVHICMNIFSCTHSHAYMLAHTHVDVCLFIYIVYVYECICILAYNILVHVYIQTFDGIFFFIRVCVLIRTYSHVHIGDMCTHTRMNINVYI